MLLFGSEEHAYAWCRAMGHDPGYAMFLPTLWQVARIWYDGRLTDSPLTRTVEEKQAILDAAGLTGDFWELPR